MYKVTLYDRGSYPNNGQVLLDTSSGTNAGIISAVVDNKLNEAGSFTFDISHQHPNYSSAYLEPMVGYVSVEDDGNEIFWGRIIAVQKKVISGSKQITCEGALSFLLDAELGIDKNGENLSVLAYFTKCINEYNTQIGTDNARNILLGQVTISKKNETHEYKNSEYTQIQNVLKNKLIDCNDGFVKIRRDDSNKKHYIDWLSTSGRENPQPIELTRNVIDQTSKDSGENIFTLVRAVGASEDNDRVKLNPVVLSNDMVNQYGKIYKTVTFGEAKSAAELQTKLNEYIDLIRDRLSITGEIKFVDMHFLQGNAVTVLCGDIFTGIVGYTGKRLVADTVSRDLLNAANDKLTLKIEKDLLGKLNSIGANSGGSGGGTSANSGRYAGSGGTLSGRAAEFKETNNVLAVRSEVMEGKWVKYEGTGLYQNEDHVAAVAGNFAVDGNNYIKLVKGAKFSITPTGVDSNVGQLIVEHDGRIKEAGELLLQYEGSYAYQHNDEIGNIVGTYTVSTKEDAQHPYVQIDPVPEGKRANVNPSMQGYYELQTGHGSISDVYVKSTDVVYDPNKTYYRKNYVVDKVTIDSGGGFEIKRNNASFGVWDKGELSAGIFVDKAQDGTTFTHIKGSSVKIGDAGSSLNLADVFQIDNKGQIQTIKMGKPVWASSDIYADGNIYGKLDGQHYIQATKLQLVSLGGGSQGVPTMDLTYSALKDMIVKASVSANTLTLWAYGSDLTKTSGDGITNFSKAASLTGTWGSQEASAGKILTVNGVPEQNPSLSYTVGFSGSPNMKLYLAGNGAPTAKSTNLKSSDRKWIQAPLRIYYSEGENDQAQEISVFTKTQDLNASPVYDNGWTAAHNCFASKTTADGKDPALDKVVADQIWIKYSNDNVDGNPSYRRYNVTADATKAYIRLNGATGTVVAEVTHDQYALGQASVKVAYNSEKVIQQGQEQETIQAIEPVTSGGSGYLQLELDIGTAPSVASPSRTVGVKVGGSLKTELSETLDDYGNGYSAGNANRASQITTATVITGDSVNLLDADTVYKFQSEYKDANGNWQTGGTKVFKTKPGTPYEVPVASGDYVAGWNAARDKIRRDNNKIYRPAKMSAGDPLAGNEEEAYIANYKSSSYEASTYYGSYHNNTRQVHGATAQYSVTPNGSPYSLNFGTKNNPASNRLGSSQYYVYLAQAYVDGSDTYTASSYTPESYSASTFSWTDKPKN